MPEIRTMTEGDFEFAVEMTAREKWFQQRADFVRLTTFEPEGCFIAWENGLRVGMICSTGQGPYAFLSSLIVPEECRGRKIGEALMRRAMDFQLRRGAETLELDGVIPALPLYRRLGFRDKYLSLRFWRPPGQMVPGNTTHEHPAPLDTIAQFDYTKTGLDRSRILGRYYEEFNDTLFTAGSGAISGYAFVRQRANDIRSIGPLIADTPAAAETILSSIIDALGDKRLVMGIPEINRESAAMALRLGFVYGQPALRMYLGKRRDYESSVYAIISPEKG